MTNLESVLTRELRPVAAPAELWERVEMPRASRQRVAVPRWTLSLAGALAGTALLVIASAWGLRAKAEIRSSDPAEIRAWVRDNTGMDVPMEGAPTVQLGGARIVNGGRAAEIVFKAAKFDATLLVSRAGPATVNPSHQTVKGLVFAVNCSSPEGLQAACRLCHG